MKYSIWTIPPTPELDKLKIVVNDLAKEYDSPSFEPHMTILGNIEGDLNVIVNRTKEVAVKTPALNLSFGPVSFSTTYFQNVLVRINSTAELLELNLKLKKSHGVENDVFMPHISLMYGEQSMAVRELAAKSIKPLNSSFKIDKLVITPSTPDPREWVHSAIIPLKNN